MFDLRMSEKASKVSNVRGLHMKSEAKLAVLERLQNKSARDAEKERVAINPQVAKKEKRPSKSAGRANMKSC